MILDLLVDEKQVIPTLYTFTQQLACPGFYSKTGKNTVNQRPDKKIYSDDNHNQMIRTTAATPAIKISSKPGNKAFRSCPDPLAKANPPLKSVFAKTAITIAPLPTPTSSCVLPLTRSIIVKVMASTSKSPETKLET